MLTYFVVQRSYEHQLGWAVFVLFFIVVATIPPYYTPPSRHLRCPAKSSLLVGQLCHNTWVHWLSSAFPTNVHLKKYCIKEYIIIISWRAKKLTFSQTAWLSQAMSTKKRMCDWHCCAYRVDDALVPKTRYFALGQAHPRQAEHNNRCLQPLAECSPHGVDSSWAHFTAGSECVVLTYGGLI